MLSSSQYEPVPNMDQSLLEEGANGNQTNMNLLSQGTAWIEEAERVKSYRKKHGIPMPPIPSFRPLLCYRWLFTVVCFWYVLNNLLGAAIEQRTILLSNTSHVSLHMSNCDLLAIKTREEPSLTLQHWKFLGGVSETFENGGDKYTLTVKKRMRLSMFRCLATISVPRKHVLEHLHTRFGGQDLSRVVLNVAPARHINVTFNEGYMEAKALPERMHIVAQMGKIELMPTEDIAQSDVAVQSKHAILRVVSPKPMSVKLAGQAKAHSILQGPSIDEKGDHVLIGSGTPQFRVTFDTEFDCAGHFTVDPGNATLVEHRGAEQDRDEPVLTNGSRRKIHNINKWIKGIADTPTPWVARIRLEGPAHSNGSWQVLSSEAFLAIPLELLILLSAGSLRPAMKDTTIQLLSPPRHYWSKGEPQSDPEDRNMWKVFNALRPLLDEDHVLTGKTIAWVPDHGRPIIFFDRGAKWDAHYLDALKKQTFMFFIAFVLNLVTSFSVGIAAVVFLTRSINHMSHLNDDDISISSSHRTYRQAISSTGWRVMATQIDWPHHAVLLRWRKQTGVQLATYFWITAESATQGNEGEAPKVVIERVHATRVPTMRDHSVILEFLFHIAGVEVSLPAEPAHLALRYQHAYRFQVEGYDNDVNPISKSEYSNEVYIVPRTSVVTLPFLILKTFFPVPTSSLAFFLDNYAQKLIDGKIPQQVVILTDMSVCYHKNFRDFPDCYNNFYVSAYMGRKDSDHQACKAQTQAGRCITYDRTEGFEPLLGMFVEDDEEKRTAPVPGQLRLGSIDRECREVTFNLRISQSDDDVAEGVLTWDDLMEQFEETEQEREADIQAAWVDLKTDKNVDYNEDYLVFFTAKVSFGNTIDPQCVAFNPKDFFFQKDSPGQIFYHGMERFVTWDPESEFIKHLYAKRAHEQTFDLFAIFPDNQDVEPKLVARDVKCASVGVSFMVDYPIQISGCYAACQLQVRESGKDGKPIPGNVQGMVLSHRFLICRTWTLAEMELMYASFCKMNNMSMMNLSTEALETYGISTSQVSLKTIPQLRRPIQFEESNLYSELIETPGLFMISSEALRAREGTIAEVEEAQNSDKLDMKGSSAGDSASAVRKMKGAPGGSDSGIDGASEEVVFHAKSINVDILENIWPLRFDCSTTGYGTNWNPAFLLMYAFYPVDNIIDFLESMCQWLKFPVYLFKSLTAIVGAKHADRFVDFLVISPLSYALPFLAEMFLFLWQLMIFFTLPSILVILALVYEFLSNSLSSCFEIVMGTHITSTYIPDVVFKSAVSGRDLHDWWHGLCIPSSVVLIIAAVTVVLFLVFIFEANLCRNLFPWWFQNFSATAFNSMGAIVVGFYGWMGFSFLVMIALWFVMAVVIYPEQMLGPLAGVLGIGVLIYSMTVKDKQAKMQIREFLRDEIPEILDLLCTQYLEDYEKKEAARMVNLEQERLKTNQSFWTRMQDHLRGQLTGERFEDILNAIVKDNSDFIHYVFDHALMKQRRWKKYAFATGKLRGISDRPMPMESEQEALKTTPVTGGESTAFVAPAKRFSKVSHGSNNLKYALLELEDIKHTDTVLTNLGLSQTDTSAEVHFDFRKRLMDKETESGGESVHIYSKQLREKLMSVFVRALDYEPMPDEVRSTFASTTAFASAMFKAHTKKLKLFEQRKSDTNRSLLQLLIQENHLQKMRKFFLYIAVHLDSQLDPKRISETVTPFVERWIPDEMNRHVRLIFDKFSVGSELQKVTEELRRWRSELPEEELKEQLTLKRLDSVEEKGVLQMLSKIGLIHARPSRTYLLRLGSQVESAVKAYVRDDASEKHSIDSADLEEFIGELTKDRLWWSAMRELLRRMGFPMIPPGRPASDYQQHSIPEEQILRQFEVFAGKKNGFLPKSDVIDFVRHLTGAEKTDGCAGRIWKAQMIGLMRHVGICGCIDLNWQKNLETNNDQDEEDGGTLERATSQYNLSDYVKYKWPEWLDRAWNKIAPEWTTDKKKTGGYGDVPLKPFIPKLDVHKFFREIAFSDEVDSKESAGLGVSSEIDDTYDNWNKADKPLQIWQKRKKKYLRLRGIWHECFLEVLKQMDNGIDDESQQITRFGSALMGATRRDPDCEGLLDVESFYNWVKQNVVEDTEACSKAVFHQVLDDANVTVPHVVADALWIAADKSESSSSLSYVRDLEDRVVMYFAKGLSYESVRTLIYDELQVPLLQEMDETEIKAAFTQVDDKTGQCGFLEPQEVQHMIRILVQRGMSMKMMMELFQTLKISFPTKELKAAFMLMDTNADDIIDVPEFLGMIDHIIVTRVPELLYGKLNMKIQQIAVKLFGLMLGAATILLFIAISMGAFQVEVAKGAAGMGASLMRAGIAIVAVLGLRNDAGDADQDKVLLNARNHLYEMFGVSNSQMEARRKAQSQGEGQYKGMSLMRNKKEVSKALKAKGFKKGRKGGKDDHDDDDDDDDDD